MTEAGERISTGDAGLDRVLCGGLLSETAVLLGGPPGAGKTILAQQIALGAATSDHPALLLSSYTEPQGKVLRHLSKFRFFDVDRANERLVPVSLAGPVSSDSSADYLLKLITESVLTHQPSVVVVDSFKGLMDVVDGDRRRFAYELVARLSHTVPLVLLVGEFQPGDAHERPEFAVADTVLMLSNSEEDEVDRRSLRVTKFRGSRFLSGRHSLYIDEGGIAVAPRLESLVTTASAVLRGHRCSLGVPGMDEHLSGGLPAGDSSLLMGPSGAGKTAIALHFLADGLRRGEPCLLVAMEEDADSLSAKWSSFGLDLDEYVESGDLTIIEASITELDMDRLASRVEQVVEEKRPARVVFDSLGELRAVAMRDGRSPGFIWALTNAARRHGASALFTLETAAQASADPEKALSHLFHDVLFLRYVEQGDALGRGLLVMKMRDSAHSHQLLEVVIDRQGARCLGPLSGVTGLLGFTALTSRD